MGLLGARLLAAVDGGRVLSGALYAVPRQRVGERGRFAEGSTRSPTIVDSWSGVGRGPGRV